MIQFFCDLKRSSESSLPAFIKTKKEARDLVRLRYFHSQLGKTDGCNFRTQQQLDCLHGLPQASSQLWSLLPVFSFSKNTLAQKTHHISPVGKMRQKPPPVLVEARLKNQHSVYFVRESADNQVLGGERALSGATVTGFLCWENSFIRTQRASFINERRTVNSALQHRRALAFISGVLPFLSTGGCGWKGFDWHQMNTKPRDFSSSLTREMLKAQQTRKVGEEL